MTINVIDKESFKILESIGKITGKSVSELINEAVRSYVEEVPELRKKNTDQAKAIEMLIDKVNTGNGLLTGNIQNKHNEYYKAELFDAVRIDGFEFLRVPGGWITSKAGNGICFMPWSDEFEEEYY